MKLRWEFKKCSKQQISSQGYPT